MPKMKTRKSVAKKVKQTGSGKFRYNKKPGARHLLTKKSAKRKRRLNRSDEVKSTELKKVKAALPYGLK